MAKKIFSRKQQAEGKSVSKTLGIRQDIRGPKPGKKRKKKS